MARIGSTRRRLTFAAEVLRGWFRDVFSRILAHPIHALEGIAPAQLEATYFPGPGLSVAHTPASRDNRYADNETFSLSYLLRYLKSALLVVWDRLPAHRSLLVREFLDSLGGQIAIECLPPYAPELNPVEYL